MNHNSKTSKNQGNAHFDYFYVTLKNWKTILIVCLVATVLGLLPMVLTTEPTMIKASFAVDLNKELISPLGTYKRKSVNPLHYVSRLEQESFKDSVLSGFNSVKKQGFKFIVESEPIEQLNDKSTFQYPYKFDFILSGKKKEQLIEINKKALKMFLQETDDRVSMDMYNIFKSNLRIKSNELSVEINLKEELIQNLEKTLNTDGIFKSTSDGNHINKSLLSNLSVGENEVIVSMLLNEGRGSEFYLKSIISIEKIKRKELAIELKEAELLLSSLSKNKKNETLENIFSKPFSNSFFLLESPEKYTPENSNRYLRRMFIALFLGFVFSTTVILVRAYYADQD